jgi:hypothetical protein
LIAPKWFIFDTTTGQQILPISNVSSIIQSNVQAVSFHSCEVTNQYNVSNYPIEQGAFSSYNKIRTPQNISLTLVQGGSESVKQALLSTVDDMANSNGLDSYLLITPFGVYPNLSVERYDFKRETKGGQGLLMVNIHFVEIMVATVTVGTSPAPASAGSQVSMGQTSGK